MEGELKRVREENETTLAHTKNLNWQYENSQATVSYMEYYQIKPLSGIYDLTSDLVVSRKSDNEIKTNWATTRIVTLHLDHMYKH